MTLGLDPDIAVALAAAAEQAALAGAVLPERGDALALRAVTDAGLHLTFAQADPAPDVSCTTSAAIADDGAEIELRWYTRSGDRPGSAVAYIHGGGMICGSIGHYDPLVRQYVQWTGVPFLSVEYRLAPEHPGETPARDSFAGLRWLVDHAAELGVDPARIAVMGDSGGGGVGAGAAILARDAGVALARQILIYPMLDDRNTEPDPHIAPTATWSYDMNYTGWRALLGDAIGTDGVSPVAAPARLADFSRLAPAYIEVGTLDIFRDESISYAQRLLQAGVDAELHVHPGSPHGHDWLALRGALAARWKADRIRVITFL
ncbi:MAG TPA: alpha/beta hydrolase [Streptosporangiaceae bacterium]